MTAPANRCDTPASRPRPPARRDDVSAEDPALPPCPRHLAPALAAPLAPARAAVVSVAPLTITSFTHEFGGSSARDAITIPGPGYTSDGFTAAFGTGDVVRIRVQPPPGKKFQVRGGGAYGATGQLSFNVYWPRTAGGVSHFNRRTVAFENFRGIAPTLGYSIAAANEVLVEGWFDYTTRGDFEFTAFVVDITVDQALARESRTFGSALSWSAPSIFASSNTTSATFRPFEIVDDLTVSATPASWGRIKALYR